MVNLYLTPLKSKPEKTSFNQEAFVALSCESKMTAKAVLLCRPNSHPFQERTLVLDQPVKVGRSVARARPSPNNGIFDCKVLSRNHALLWYENGKFFLQDTKSSNGTFVNNQRLSKGSDESAPREVCSGDIVQFGVDVMENSRKVTHGCIVATLKLFLPDGKEAKASPSTVMLPTCPGTIAQRDLYELGQYLNEALHREELLQEKLVTLQKIISTTEECADRGWQAMIDEDRLLTRLEILENQLRACSKNMNEDALREEVVRLLEDKDRYQASSKESLKKILMENKDVVLKLQDAERVLNNSENECKILKQIYENTQKEIKDMAEKYNARVKEIQDLNEKINELESKNSEKIENDVGKTPAIIINDHPEVERTIMKENAVLGDSMDDSMQGEQDDNEENNKEGCLKESDPEVIDNKSKVEDINKMLEKAQVEATINMNKVSQIEVNLSDAKHKAEKTALVIKQLNDKIAQLEEELSLSKAGKDNTDKLTIVYTSELETPTPTITLPLPGRRNSSGKKTSETHNGEVPVSSSQNNLQTQIDKLKEILQETRDKKIQVENEILNYKSELEEAKLKVEQANEDSCLLKQQLQNAQKEAAENFDAVNSLRDQLKEAESSSREGQLQLNSLKDRLGIDEQRYQQKQLEVDHLRQQLSEVLHNYKQAHNEAEQLRNKVEVLLKQIDKQSPDNQSSLNEEYSTLKQSYQILETEINNVKAENLKLRENFNVFPQSDERPEVTTTHNEDSVMREEVETTKRKLMEAYAQIVNLKETCDAYNEEKTRLHRELSSNQEFHIVRYLVPLIVAGILYYVLHW